MSRKIDPELEAMLETGQQHKEQAIADGLPWLCQCECCQRLRAREAAAHIGAMGGRVRGATKRRGSAEHYSEQSLRNWAEVHRREAEEAGKPWTCACRSCTFVREGKKRDKKDTTQHNRMEEFQALRPGAKIKE